MAQERAHITNNVAIVGSACRFAGGVNSPSKLWDLLRHPVDVLSEIPPTRFDVEKYYHPDPLHSGTSNVRHAYTLSEDHRAFDASFFRFTSIEAAAIDPQQRILLETTYEALESAGLPLEQVQGSNTGVWVGLMGEDYSRSIEKDLQNLPTYFASGTARNNVSNRISYVFDLHGPSMTIDTACSSSLVALHQAVASLRSGEVSIAIVAGANLLLGPEQFIASSKLKMLSSSGRSRMWDKSADGYARGDGFGVIVLKTLPEARAARDDIECIIRETGVNQDGRTRGITMPNAAAQADLIRSTYKRAGLDLSRLSDRPQYFEAHGTGTPAGDPIEAEAISNVFFGRDAGFNRTKESPPLYVGSAKTILGHTEGTAGILGVMKTSLALQHAFIPPNLLLYELNPTVKPFCTHLKVPREGDNLEWPSGAEYRPRRASVNSFGFGGTNATCILESPQPNEHVGNSDDAWHRLPLTPFNFSAGSEKSLRNALGEYASFLRRHPQTNLRDLAWTLNTRRSTLPARMSIYAPNSKELTAKLDAASYDTESFPVKVSTMDLISSRSTGKDCPRVMGIFTGQGAQWAGMMGRLIQESPLVEMCFENLQTSLDSLPKAHAPTWRLREELLKDAEESRINQGIFSQPLCTAIQIALVQLLWKAGVHFSVVVGHSSGEIAAAYAAGHLSAENAIRIAYYRGLYVGKDTRAGAMLAVGTSPQDAEELCTLPALEGRICVAARNSPNSVTLSGDADAIQDAQEIMDDEGKFSRKLKVDRAYHSHHMRDCARQYVGALRSVLVGSQASSSHPSGDDAVFRTTWVSSVTGQNAQCLGEDHLRGRYWGENMCQPVLFYEALDCALSCHGPFDVMIEVGPHPALKSPVSDTTKASLGQPDTIPYVETLIRRKDDVEAFALTLGCLWKSGIPVDFGAFESAVYGHRRSKVSSESVARAPKVLKNLPKYCWDHERVYAHDSRRARSFRTQDGGMLHQSGPRFGRLLGAKCLDRTENEHRFKNHLCVRDYPWLVDHQIQGEVVLPAAAYICAVVEAAVQMFSIADVRLIEFRDVSIMKTVAFPGADSVVMVDSRPSNEIGVETYVCLNIKAKTADHIDASFSFSSCSDSDTKATSLTENCRGELWISRRSPTSGQGNDSLLPCPRTPRISSQLLSLESETFYHWAGDLGYGYQGGFRGLCSIKRKLNESTGIIQAEVGENGTLLHPAPLDCIIQAALLAYCCPEDGRMRSLYMPTKIDLLQIDFQACQGALAASNTNLGVSTLSLPYYSSVVPSSELVADVEIHDPSASAILVQMQGLRTTSLNPPSADNDVNLFFEMGFGPEMPESSRPEYFPHENQESQKALCVAAERLALFYLRRLGERFPKSERAGLEWYHLRLLDYVDHCLDQTARGVQRYAAKDWMTDCEDDIVAMIANYSPVVDFRLIPSVGENLPRAIESRGEISIWEAMTRDEMLADYYSHGIGMSSYLLDMGRMVGQLGHRFPRMNILEIGAGTGAATASILSHLDGNFSSYTYTDISSSFFEGAQARLSQRYPFQMAFRTLDIETPVTEQGYSEASYDLIVASLTLHATGDLEKSLANTRKLLRPGGYLVMLELTDADSLRVGLIFGGLSGWWLGSDADGRRLSPCLSCEVWSGLLRKTGFSAIDAVTPSDNTLPVPLSVMVCQAIDDRVAVLRAPIANADKIHGLDSLTIVGTGDFEVADRLRLTMAKHYRRVRCFQTLAAAVAAGAIAGESVVSLTDAQLELPTVFEEPTELVLSAVKKMFKDCRIAIWVSWGCRAERPHANMFRGLRRSVALELVDTRVQTLDFDAPERICPDIIATRLLQLEAYGAFGEVGSVKDILWHCEPEVFVEHGRVIIPRLQQSQQRNQRYNSTRRFITRDVSVATTSLSIESDKNYYQVVEEKPSSLGFFSKKIKLSHSMLKPVRIGSTAAFLSLGRCMDTGGNLLVLSSKLTSHVQVTPGWTVPMPKSSGQGVKALLLLHAHLVACSILAMATAGPKRKWLVVLDPELLLGEALVRLAADDGFSLVLITTASTARKRSHPWVYLHPRETAQSIRQILPASPFVFVNMSAEERSQVSALVCRQLPGNCTQISSSWILSDHVEVENSLTGIKSASDCLQAAWLQLGNVLADVDQNVDSGLIRQLDLDKLTVKPAGSSINTPTNQTLLSWESCETVRVQVQPASTQIHFAADKTYWLVGLTGGLGLSTAQWMAGRGARHIALSSRNPQVDPEWLHSMASRGCSVRVFSNDVVDRESVRNLHRKLSSTMPPIAGVAQGAMVLHDTVFPDLDVDRLQKTLGPKVQGSLFLDELFPDNTLDFFVFFSSMAYVVGNRGQSSYTAANAFMASLAGRRRLRGLAGSVINIGGIVGEGYVSRQLAAGKQSALAKAGFEFMSEQAFHELFAEGVLASPPESGRDNFEISSGLRVGAGEGTSFANNPMFQYVVAKTKNPADSSHGDPANKSGDSVKARLLEATSISDVVEIMRDGVFTKLKATMHADLDRKNIMNSSPDNLGVDSLIAVDLQSWFRKEMGIDLSVMKILNATSMDHLVDSAMHLLPADRTPKLEAEAPQDQDCTGDSERGGGVLANGTKHNGQARKDDPVASATALAAVGEGQSLAVGLESSSSSGTTTSLAETDTVPDILLGDASSITTTAADEPSTSEALSAGLSFSRSVPMSFAQSRFWFLKFAVSDQTAFNVTTLIRLRGQLDVGRLSAALVAVGQRHEAIRTAFYVDPLTKQHMQGVLPQPPIHLEYSPTAGEEEVEAAVEEMRDHVFDLSRGLLLRLRLLSLGNGDYVIVLGYHHIAMDGIGNQVFLSDLERFYQGRQLEAKSADEDEMMQYPDFTLRQFREYKDGAWSKDLSYWHHSFPDLPPPLPLLSLSHRPARPSMSTYRSYSAETRLDPALKLRIRQICQQLKVTPFHFYLTVFGCLVFRYSQAEDFCIGVADGNRKEHDVLRSLGLFLNLLPLRFRPYALKPFSEALGDVKKTSDGAFAHSRPPIDVLFDELDVPRSPSHAPLFQVFMNYRPHISDSRPFCGCEAQGELIAGGQTTYDISLDILDSSTRENRLVLSVNSGLYTAEDARLLQQSYLNLLQEFVHSPNMSISLPQVHTEQEVMKGVQLGRGPEVAQSLWPATVIHRIDEMASTYRDRTALTDGKPNGKRLTYQQMAASAGVIAWHLLALLGPAGVEGHLYNIGIFQMPGPEWICSLLAVLRLGATCVPFDRQLGLPRLMLVAQDCRPRILLVDDTTKHEHDFLQRTGATVVNVSDILTSATQDGEALKMSAPNRAQPSGRAIITYSSGSTGIPKGSVVQHAAYRNFVEFAAGRWGLVQGEETVLQQSSYAFDLSIGQIQVCLAYGGTLVVPDDARRRDPAAICDIMAAEGVSFTIATPTEYLAWFATDASAGDDGLLRRSKWKIAVTAGEAVATSLVQEFRSLFNQKPELRLINVYGPSETTIGCADGFINLAHSQHEDPHEVIASVSPLPNYAITIVDSDMRPVPVGVPGEILIRGAGVGEGYLGRSQLTAAAFVPDDYASPFFKSQGWSRGHLSGDRGRLDHDGRLHLHGRIRGSTQIKLGGVRMDLQDIESTILAEMAPLVRQAVVSLRRTTDHLPDPRAESQLDYLVAFVVLSKPDCRLAEEQCGPEADADFLAGLPSRLPLPRYMRPSVAVAIDAVPTTINGKIDRTAVDSIPTAPQSSRGDNADGNSDLTQAEESLWSLWKEVLPRDIPHGKHRQADGPRSRSVDFFHVGGTSLSLITLQSLIRKRLHRTVSIESMFGASTLGHMALLLQDAGQVRSRHRIDWDEETKLPPGMLSLAHKPKSDRAQTAFIGPSLLQHGAGEGIQVVLTGSTGFFGKEILRQLLLNSNVAHIYCIAVRTQPSQLPKDLFTSPKVTVYQGDLCSNQLGLSDHDAAAVFASADAIVHCGANVSFMEAYHSLRLPNVTSTKELARLTVLHATRDPVFHYVSTASAAGLSGQDTWGPWSLRGHQPRCDGSDGYVASKWASEVFLENAAAGSRLRVVVHRPSSIVGADAPQHDLLRNLLWYAVKTRTVPDGRAWRGYLDFVRVENAAVGLVSEVVRGSSSSSSSTEGIKSAADAAAGDDCAAPGTRYVYEAGDVVVALDKLAEAVEAELSRGQGNAAREGEPSPGVSVLPMAEWIDVIEKSGMHPLLATYLRSIGGDVRVLFPRLSGE